MAPRRSKVPCTVVKLQEYPDYCSIKCKGRLHDGGVVHALRCFERGLVVPAADRLVHAVLQKLGSS